MPRKLIEDYVFYKIISKNSDIDFCYVGSTISMNQRKDNHKCACNNPNNENHRLKVYKTIRENGGWNMFRMVEIGYRKQLTSAQARIVEDEYMVLLNADLNTYRGHRSLKQRAEYMKEYNKQYRETHVEEMKEYWKDYYQINKEELKKLQKGYNEKNKERLNVKHACPCGGKFLFLNKSHHEKTIRHKAYVKEQSALYTNLEQQQTDTEVV